jgi:hypothetical protein
MDCKCKLCNRPLKNKKAIKLGYGSTCIKKTNLVVKRGKVIGMRLDK